MATKKKATKKKATKVVKKDEIDFGGQMPPGVDPYWFRKERAKLKKDK